MNLSKHAQVRGKQRGIPRNVIEIIYEYGTLKKKPGNAIELEVTKKQKNKIVSELKRLIQNLDKISNKALLVSSEGKVITVYNKKNNSQIN